MNEMTFPKPPKPGYYWVHWSSEDRKYKDIPFFVVHVIEIEFDFEIEHAVYVIGESKDFPVDAFKDWYPIEEPQIIQLLQSYSHDRHPISPSAQMGPSAKQGPTMG